MRTRDEDTALVIASADYFTAVAFRGRARYDRVEVPSLEAAREAAAGLYVNRPVGIYAVARVEGSAREVHIENWEPKIKRMENKK